MQCSHGTCRTWWSYTYAKQTPHSLWMPAWARCDDAKWKWRNHQNIQMDKQLCGFYSKLAVWWAWRQMSTIDPHSAVPLLWEHACSVNHQANNSMNIVCYANVHWMSLLHEAVMHEPIYLFSTCCAHWPKSKCIICSHLCRYTYVNKANMKARSSHSQQSCSQCALWTRTTK